jgi:hypothetical protein
MAGFVDKDKLLSLDDPGFRLIFVDPP